MDTRKLADMLKILANVHRANIMRFLHEKGRSGFVDIMEQLGLDPKADCGTFGYHLSELQKTGVLRRDSKGLYSLTELGNKIWLSMQQIDHQIGNELPSFGEDKISITRFREQDIPDLVRWFHEEKGEAAPVELVEAVTRYNHFVDGPFGSFLGQELRTHSFIARSIPDGEVFGFIRGFTYFDPDGGGRPLYGEQRLTLFVREPALSSDCDKELLFSLLFREMVKVADENGYHLQYESWIQVDEKQYEIETFKDLGLKTIDVPKTRRVWYRPPDWLTEYTLRRLKIEGYNGKLIDLIAIAEPFKKKTALARTSMKLEVLKEQLQKLVEKGVVSETVKGWRLSEKYQVPGRK